MRLVRANGVSDVDVQSHEGMAAPPVDPGTTSRIGPIPGALLSLDDMLRRLVLAVAAPSQQSRHHISEDVIAISRYPETIPGSAHLRAARRMAIVFPDEFEVSCCHPCIEAAVALSCLSTHLAYECAVLLCCLELSCAALKWTPGCLVGPSCNSGKSVAGAVELHSSSLFVSEAFLNVPAAV